MLRRVAALAAIAGQAAALVAFAALCVYTLRTPYPFDFGEGVILDQVMRLSRGGNIYPASLATPPYLVTNYPPLFFVFQAPLAVLFGPAYWYGRLISQLSACAAALFAGGVAWRMSRDCVSAAAVAALTLGAGVLGRWAQFDRVDLLALALGWAALFVLASNGRRAVIATAVLIAAAGFTRQTSWAAPLAAGGAWLIASKRGADAMRLAIAVAVFGLAGLGLLQVATGGFLRHIAVSAGDPWTWSGLEIYAANMGWQIRPLMLLALAGGVAAWRTPSPWAALAGAYMTLAIVEGSLAGKAGAFWNYFIEFNAGCAMLAGLALSAARGRSGLRAAALALVALQGALSAYVYASLRPPLGSDQAVVLDEMRRTTGEIVSDSHLGLIPLSGHRVYIEPFRLSSMAASGRWDEAPFVADLEAGRIALAVVRQSRGATMSEQFTPRMQAALRAMPLCRALPAGPGETFVFYRPRCVKY